MKQGEAAANLHAVWDRAWAHAQTGHGTVEYFYDPARSVFFAETEKIGQGLGLPASQFLQIDLTHLRAQAYAPMPEVIARAISPWSEKDRTNFFNRKGVYRRHQALLRSRILPGSPMPPHQEDLIAEELPFEMPEFVNGLLTLLGALGDKPFVLFCSGAEHLLPETAKLLSFEAELTARPLILFFCFGQMGEEGNLYPAVEDFIRARTSVGRLLSLSEPGGVLPAEDNLPSLDELESMVGLLSFDGARPHLEKHWQLLEGTSGPMVSESQIRTLSLLALAAEGRADFDQALFYGQLLLGMVDYGHHNVPNLITHLNVARFYRRKNDNETASRLTFKCWKTFWREAALTDRVRIDFTLFTLSGSMAPEYSEAYKDLETRLTFSLSQLGWKNHLSFVLTRNTRVMEEYWKSGFKTAEANCRRGLDLSLEIGNLRRTGTAYHSLGTLYQARGDKKQAEQFYRKALRLLEVHTTSVEAARTRNGLGYFYFCLGEYSKAMHCHRDALNELHDSRQYEEILSTLINIARLYLFTGQAASAVTLLDAVLLIMDRLKIADLPFHPRRNLYSIIGMALVKMGQLTLAQEFQRKLRGLPNRGRGLYLSGNQLHFEALVAAERGEQERAVRLFGLVTNEHARNMTETRHLLLLALIDYAHYLDRWGRTDEARAKRQEAIALIEDKSNITDHSWELGNLKAAQEGKPLKPHKPLPQLAFNPQSVLQLVEQDATLTRLQRKIREGHFLQKWQDRLNQEKSPARLLRYCEALISENFLVDEVVISPIEIPGLTQDPSARYADLIKEFRFRFGDKPYYTTKPSEAAPFAAFSYLPLVFADRLRFVLLVASRKIKGALTLDDHRILLLASRQLSTALLASLRSSELENRQKALEVSHGELTRALRSLKETQSHLVQSEKMAALGGLVAGVAHEINTPLGVSITAASFLQQSGRELEKAFAEGNIRKSDLSKFIEVSLESSELILRNLSRADTLIQSFKQVAADQSSEQRRTFHLREYTQEILNSLRPKWKTSPIKVELEGPDKIQVDSYPGAFAQIVTNLLVNSLTHAFDGKTAGRIVLSAGMEGDQCRLSITDDGNGIPPENLPRIFEPFFTTRRGQGGTGLGLHIVYNLVSQLLGGTITCQSEVGQGTTFLLSFPPIAPERGNRP